MIRAVIDTNAVVSAILTPAGTAARVVESAGSRFLLVWTPAIVAECLRVLAYPHVARLLTGREEYGRRVVAALARGAELVPGDLLPAVRIVEADAADDVLFAVAMAGGARYVVSGDRAVQAVGIHAGVMVMSPAAFLGVLAAGK